jgi:hypothetical protein
MKLREITLVDQGFLGVVVSGLDPVKGEKHYFLDDLTRERRSPVPEHIMKKFKKLNYYFLNITGHWISVYDKYLNDKKEIVSPEEATGAYMHFKSLWDSAVVTKIKADDSSFILAGQVERVEDKPVKIRTPKITAEDDLGFYADARDDIQSLFHDILLWIDTKSLPSADTAKHYIQSRGNDKDQASLSSMDQQEIIDTLIQSLDSKGFIVMMNAADEDQVRAITENSSEDDSQIYSSGNIDSDRMPEVEGIFDDDQEEVKEDENYPEKTSEEDISGIGLYEEDAEDFIQPDKVRDPFGPPASEGDFKNLKEEFE